MAHYRQFTGPLLDCVCCRSVLRLWLLVASMGAWSSTVLAVEPASEPDVSSALQFVRIKPSEADPKVVSFDEPNLIVVDQRAAVDSPLAVFLPGTGGRPENAQLLLSVIAGQGYRTIGLEYNDEPAVVQVCPRDPDPACSGEFRRERAFGGADGARVHNSVEESVVGRLVSLLRYLDRTRPKERWRDFLVGDEPVWSRIVVSGLSQGAGMAAYIAKRKLVARVVLFSSPWDFLTEGETPAPWLGEVSATPPERWYAELHRRENTFALIAQAYRSLAIPEDHILVFDLEPVGGGKGRNPFHGSTVRLPGNSSNWKWMFGLASDLRRVKTEGTR